MLISEWKPILYIVLAIDDEYAFDTLMDVCSPSLYRYALGIVRSREVAEEIVSDVFMEVWKMRGSLLEISSLESWMRKVTYCKVVTALRHDYSRPEGVSIDDIVNFNIDIAPSPDEEIISERTHRYLIKRHTIAS